MHCFKYTLHCTVLYRVSKESLINTAQMTICLHEKMMIFFTLKIMLLMKSNSGEYKDVPRMQYYLTFVTLENDIELLLQTETG